MSFCNGQERSVQRLSVELDSACTHVSKKAHGTCCLRPILKMGEIRRLLSEPLGHVITPCGQILVIRTGDDLPPPPLPRVSIHPKRLRAHIQNVSVCTGTTRTCRNTCVRGAGTHGPSGWTHAGFQRATHTHTPHHDHNHSNDTQRHQPTNTHLTTHSNITATNREERRDQER